MNYRKMSMEELSGYRYPNLVAEIIESGYSMCTLSEHRGYGRCEQSNPFIRSKVFGNEGISGAEGAALAGLFGCEAEYLFSKKLKVIDGRTAAFYRP